MDHLQPIQNKEQSPRLASPEKGSCDGSPAERLQDYHDQPLDLSRSGASSLITAPSKPDDANGSMDNRFDRGDDGDHASVEDTESSSSAAGKGAATGVRGSVKKVPMQDDSAVGPECSRGEVPAEDENKAHLEFRMKNNEAARRLQAARKAKIEESARLVAFYEVKNAALRLELKEAQDELMHLNAALFHKLYMRA